MRLETLLETAKVEFSFSVPFMALNEMGSDMIPTASGLAAK